MFPCHHSAQKLKTKALQFIIANYNSSIVDAEGLMDFRELDGDLLLETKAALDLAMKRKGCLGCSESEKKFGNICIIM